MPSAGRLIRARGFSVLTELTSVPVGVQAMEATGTVAADDYKQVSHRLSMRRDNAGIA